MGIMRAATLVALLGTVAILGYSQRAAENEGSQESPVALTVGEPHSGRVGTDVSFYVAEVQDGARYELTLTNMTDDADLYLYGGDRSFDEYLQVSDHGATEPESLVTQARGPQLFISVDGGFTDAGTRYSLAVREFAGEVLLDEGSPDDPIEVEVATPYFGTVGTGTSYYVAEVEPSALYEIVLTGLIDAADIEIFADRDFSDLLGSSTNSGDADEEFRIASLGERLFISIDGGLTSRGSPLSLAIDKLGDALASEGSRSAPLRLAIGRQHAGSVSNNSSYYQISVQPELVYNIELSELQADADLEVYHDAGLTDYAGGSARGGNETDLVQVIPTGSTLYIVVDGSLTDAGTSLSLAVARGGDPPRAEGRVSIEPRQLQIGVPHDGQVNTGRSYYVVAVTPGLTYDVSLAGMTADGDLYVHDDDPTYAKQQQSSARGGADDDSVQVEASGRSLFISVDGSNTNIGTTFQILVTDRGAPTAAEGTGSSAVELTLGRARRGQVDTSRSIYWIAAEPGRNYILSLTDMSDDIDLYIYADLELSQELASSINAELAAETLEVAAPGRRLVIVADGSYTSSGGTFTVTAEAR
jgi:hypothetical protein